MKEISRAGKELISELEIPAALQKQYLALEELEKATEQLSVKIQPILRNEPVEVASKDMEEMQSTVPLVNEIVDKTKRIERIVVQLNSLHSLCEY